MPRIAHLLLLASGVGLLACADGLPTEPEASAGSALQFARSAPPSRPAGGKCQTQFAFLSDVVVQIELDCNLLHLGLASGTSTQTITVTGQSQTGQLTAVLSSSPVYTAANGDLLNASFTGTGLIDPVAGTVTYSGTETFSGGTGRFAGASGSVALNGTASLITMSGSYTTTGSLRY